MALHRDIFWVGRQWAVTALGMQAVNQKLLGQFDIEIARLWDDSLLDVLRAQQWINAEDFAKGLAVARKRFPEPAHKPPPLPIEALLQVIAAPATPPQPKPAPETAAIAPVEPDRPAARLQPGRAVVVEAVEPAETTPSFLQMRLAEHSGKLVRVWRIKRQ